MIIKNKNPSRFFTITLLVCLDISVVKAINKSIERTFKNKLLPKAKYRKIHEVKATKINPKIKEYFIKQAEKKSGWSICSLILHKETAAYKIKKPINIHRVYNVMADELMRKVDFSKSLAVNLFVDQSKNRSGIDEFNTMLRASLNMLLPLDVPINITHVCSQKNRGVQAVDLFCWGIFRRYEQKDMSWYNLFKERIVLEKLFVV